MELCNHRWKWSLCDYPPSPHQTAPPLWSDVGEHAHTYIKLSHPPNITSLNFHIDLFVSPLSCHMHFVPQPLSSYLHGPTDDTILCSSIPDSTLVLNGDRSVNEVGVSQPTCDGIHEEHYGELNHPSVARDHPCLSVPPFFPAILDDPTILDFSCASPSTDELIVDHS